MLGSPLLYRYSVSLAQLAAKHRLPTVSAWREFPEAGGLASYGTDIGEMFQRAAGLVDRILKGAKPAELPVEQPTKFELVVNLKTAKAFGEDPRVGLAPCRRGDPMVAPGDRQGVKGESP